VAFRRQESSVELPLTLPPQGTSFVLVPRTAQKSTVVDPIVGVSQEGKEILFEPSTDRPPLVMKPEKDGRVELLTDGDGQYQVAFASGRKVGVTLGKAQMATVSGPWQVEFPPGWGAPERVVFPTLISWTEHPEPGIKYFSGVATYRTTFRKNPNMQAERILLDLGEIRFVGEVHVNGELVGNLWTPPYEVDITEVVRDGENELVVRVANDWSNRLTGDAREPQFGTFTYTNIKNALAWRVPWKDAPLHRSGLLGPVVVKLLKPVAISTRGE